MENNGLILKQVSTSLKNDYGDLLFADYDELENFLSKNFDDNGYIIIYLDYKVLIRNFRSRNIDFFNNEESFNPEFVQKLRLFNKKKELYIWRTEGKWRARLRSDEEKGDTDAVEVNQVLFGTEAKSVNGYTLLTEDRGTEIILPFELDDKVDAKKNRVKIKTLNYISYNELGQAGYCDSRFVEFTFGKDNKAIGE